MRRACFKPSFAAIALLAAFVSAESLRAQQTPLEKAEALLSKGATVEAVVVLRQIVMDDPGNVDAHLRLGTALALIGKRSESINQMAVAVQLRPDSAGVHNQYGMVLSRFIEVTAARQEFEKALELNPALAEAHVNLSLILAQAGELISAGNHLDQAIKIQGDVRAAAYTHYLRGKIWLAQKETTKSESELQIAVKLRPNYAEAWSDLGGVRRLEGDSEGARQALEQAVALDSGDEKAQYRLGAQCLENGEPHKAVDHFRKALRHDPDDRATLYNLALALRRDGQASEAQRVADKLSKIFQTRNNAAALGSAIGELNDAGMRLEKSGDVKAALVKYRAGLDLDPSDIVVRLNYGLALCRLARWQEGAEELREVLRLDPNNAEAAKGLYIAIDQARAQRGDAH